MKHPPHFSHNDKNKIRLGNVEWREILDPDVYYIAREKGTERAFTGEYWNHEETGTYFCKACGQALFKSEAKFQSMCGWPSFFEPIEKESITFHDDFSHSMYRIEVQCGRCESHLGHIFDDGPPPTHKRFCINSAVLIFKSETEE